MTADNVVLFDAQAKNGLGQYSAYNLADGRTVTKEYHHGFLQRTHAEDIQDLHLAFDYCTANVTSRWDAVKSLKESFEYDALNRLTSAQVFPVDANGIPTGLSFPPVQYGYDGDIGSTNGNLVLRDDVGQLGYGVHAVTAARNIDYPTPLDAPPFAISQATQDVSYTPYLKPHKVNETVGTDAFELEFEYGPELQRTRSMLRRNGTTVNTKVYLGDYEVQTIDGIAEQIHYITGGDGLCAIITQGSGSARIHATYTDHLGSIVAVTHADGLLVAEQSFDAWGRRRKPEDWSTNDTPVLPNWLYRGYTGHEHAEPFGLINMNSRMYDPLTGRMLSTDNYVNGQSATQAFNRYSYAGNNPLKYTDPSGDYMAIAFYAVGMAAELLSNAINGSGTFKQANENVNATKDGMSNSGMVHNRLGENATLSFGIDPFAMGLGVRYAQRDGDATYGASLGIGALGGSYGAAFGSWKVGDFTVGSSVGVGADGAASASVGGTYKDAVSFGITRFGGEHAQWNWQGGFKSGNFSFRMTNDAWMGSDWYRSAAAEASWEEFSIGFSLFTSQPPKQEYDDELGKDDSFKSMWDGAGKSWKKGTYSEGERKYARLYLGYNDGFTVSRIGVDAAFVQDFSQNGIHRLPLIRSPYFNTKLGPPPCFYWDLVPYNPWSLY